MTTADQKEDQDCSDVAQQMNAVIDSVNACIDRGVDPQSGKRGMCHVFKESDICLCGKVDLAKERERI